MTTPGADERRDVKSFAKRAFQGTVAKKWGIAIFRLHLSITA
jgi:hypothetical protein